MVLTAGYAHVLIDLKVTLHLVQVSSLDGIKSQPYWNKDEQRLSLLDELMNLVQENIPIDAYMDCKVGHRFKLSIEVSQRDRDHLRAVSLTRLQP